MNGACMALVLSALVSLPPNTESVQRSIKEEAVELLRDQVCPGSQNPSQCHADFARLHTLVRHTQRTARRFDELLPKARSEPKKFNEAARKDFEARKELESWLQHIWKTY